MSWIKKIGSGYSELWKAIIRPPKDEYCDSDLGPKEFVISKNKIQRSDLYLRNKKGLKLACSFFEPLKRRAPFLPCVIYLHGNSSSRLEALSCIEVLLPLNITLFCFDFSGCGLSEGEYISLGHFEKDDVDVVINYLRSLNTVSSIGIWGRSMGAVTAIMHSIRDPTIGGMVLDSPFMSLKVLATELCREHTKIPKTILDAALKMIRKTILQKAGFDILELEPIKYVGNSFIPSFFIAGKDDNFIKPHHSQLLCEKYAGDKNISIVVGDHNDDRPEFLMNSIAIFFYNCLQCEILLGQKMQSTIGKNLNSQQIHNSNKKEPKIGNEKEVDNVIRFLEQKSETFQKKDGEKLVVKENNPNFNDEQLWEKLQFCEFSKEEAEWNDKVLDKEISDLLGNVGLIEKDQEGSRTDNKENSQKNPQENIKMEKINIINDDLLNINDNAKIPQKSNCNLFDIDFFYEEKKQ